LYSVKKVAILGTSKNMGGQKSKLIKASFCRHC